MDYLVVYISKTGNTQKVAVKIFETIPGRSKDIVRLEELRGEEADTYFIGFWNNRGSCERSMMDFLSSLHGKRVALFGTCGLMGNKGYLKQIERQVAVFLPEDNQYLGCFLCAGKLGPFVLEKYRQLQAIHNTPEIRALISAYEDGMLHPNEQDLEHASQFVTAILNQEIKEKEFGDGMKG